MCQYAQKLHAVKFLPTFPR